MTLSIIAFIVIVGIAIMVKTGWRPSRPNIPSINWMEIVTKLAVVALLLGMTSCFVSYAYKSYKATTTPRIPPLPARVAPEYPTSGEGYATKEKGLEAWIDPMKTYLRPTSGENPNDSPQPARYVFAKNKKIYFDDTGPFIGAKKEVWWKMPAGNYLVYPLGGEKIYFRWWQ